MLNRTVTKPIVRPLIGKQLVLGHDAIDLDHRAIANCWHKAVQCQEIEFPLLIARLKKTMRNHFEHEAALMERAGGALCACHGREHQVLLDLCEEATALSRHNWRKTQSLLRTRFPKLVRDHIICTDQIAVLFLNTNGAMAQAC